MIPQSPQKAGRQGGHEEQEFLEIARHVSETIGAEFFSMLTDQLAGALRATRAVSEGAQEDSVPAQKCFGRAGLRPEAAHGPGRG